MKITSLKSIRRNNWLFKVSANEDTILVHAFNETHQWSQIRFFNSKDCAKNWVDYLVMHLKELHEKP